MSYEVRPKNINILYDIYKIRSELIKNKILNLKKTESGFPYEEIDAFNFLKFGINKMKKNPYYFLKQISKNKPRLRILILSDDLEKVRLKRDRPKSKLIYYKIRIDKDLVLPL